MEHSKQEVSLVNAPIRKDLGSHTVWLIIVELTLVDGAIGKLESSLTLLSTVFPFTSVCCSVTPLTNSNSVHFAEIPLAIILPSLLFADKQARSLLIPFGIFPFIVVTIGPFPDAKSPWKTLPKLSGERLIFPNYKLSIALHLSFKPFSLILLAITPCLDSISVGHTSFHFPKILASLISDFSIFATEQLLTLQVTSQYLNSGPIEPNNSQLLIIDYFTIVFETSFLFRLLLNV